LAYQLPGKRLSLDELERSGSLTSSARFLHELGFGYCHVGGGRESFDDMLVDCGRRVLTEANLPRDDVRWLFQYSGLERNGAVRDTQPASVLRHFRYPVARAHHRLDLPSAASVAVGQQGCSGLLSTLHVADHMLSSSDAGSVLCLAGDFLPEGSGREVLYNVMSDACAAVLVQRDPGKNRIVHFYQHAVPYFWDTPAHQEELLSSYFPLAQRVIATTLAQAEMSVDDVAWFVPHNVNFRSWEILAELVGVGPEKVWSGNIARVGHTVSCDHIINMKDMEDQGVLQRGDRLVLFTFGFGANWSCMIVEH
jgi:3-oxoacyl-[acyl-carrier-protein] synthase-3